MLEGSQAGTALRASFIKLAKPTKASAKAMEEMGISLSDSKGNFVGMPALIKQFQDGMKGMTKEQKLANVSQIVGTEAASGFLTLIDAGPSKIDKFSKSLKNSDGASKKAADRMKDNLKGSLEQLGGAFESAGIIIGNLFAPILRKLADTITWLVEKLNGMSRGMQITMVVLATLAAAIGPLVFVFGAFISVLGSAMTYLAPFLAGVAKAGGLITFLTTKFPMLGSAITLLSGPVGWIVAGIVALGAAFVIAYKKSETFRNVVNGALNGVKQTFITIGNIVKGFFQLFKGNGQDGVITLSKILPPNVVIGLTNFATKVKTIFMSIVTAVVNFAKSIGAQLQAFWAQNGVHIMAALNNIKSGFIAVWNVIKPIINAIWIAVKWTFTQILNVIKFMMPVITNILKVAWWLIQSLIVSVWNNIKGVISGALNVIMGVIKVFSGLFTGNFKLMWSGVKQIFFGALQFIWNLVQLWFVGKIFGVFKLGFSLIKGVVTRSLGGVKSAFTWSLSGIWNIVKSVFTNIWTFTKYIFTNIWTFTKSVWGNIRLAVTNPVGFINKVVPRTFRIMSNVIRAIFNGLKKSVTVIFSTMRTVVYNIAKALSNLLRGNFSGMRKNLQNITTALKNMVIKLWRILKNTVVNIAKSLWNGVKGIFGNLFNSVKSTTQKLKDAVIARWKSIKTSVTDLATKAKNGVVNGFKAMYDKGVSWIDKLKTFLGDSISGFKKSAKSLGKGVANGAISGLNAMIDGINTLSDKIMKKKLIKNKIPKLSTGTGVKTDSNGLLKRGTRAVVNDRGPGNANGPNGHKELIYRRSGKIERPIGNNKKVNLRRGDGVINGAQSKSLLPHFAKGTGINWLDDATGAVKGAAEKGMHKASDGAKGLVEGGKNLAGNAKKAFDKTMGDVMDYVKNPMKLVDKTMKLFGVDFSGVKGAMGGMMDFGYKGLKKSIKDLVEGWFAEAEGGDGDSAWLLKHNILQTFGHYKGMTMNGTSRHWGVDFGMPTGTKIRALTAGKISQAGWVNGGGGNQVTLDEPGGKWFQWYMHMRNGGVKVKKGQKVKAGDLLGYSGSTGSSNTPHLHIQRMKGYPSNDTAVDPMSWLKSLKGGGSKSASKWKSEVKQALKMNGLPTTSAYVNAWIKQIDTESSGNSKAMGGTDGLNDGRAQGLVQVKPGTFNANKFKGHGNIMNGLDNLLAGIRYAKGRYGANGMLNVIGKGHGYATGGLINSNGWYNLAEGGYPEFVIPTDPSKKTDAMKMLAIAANEIQGKPSNNKRPNQLKTPKNSNNSSDDTALLLKMIEGQQQQIALLAEMVESNQEIASKDYEPSISKYPFEEQVIGVIEKYNRTKNRNGRFSPA